MAEPADGRVSINGGTVTLESTGSGGPWGTNVTYLWKLREGQPGVTVTFDDVNSATSRVTIPALSELPAGTKQLKFRLIVSGRGDEQGTDEPNEDADDIVAGKADITVTVNTVPTAEDVEVTAVEDTAYAFSAADFNFTDDDDDALASVAITSLPAAGKGTLELGGTAIPETDLPQTVTADQLQAESLKYTPPANQNGQDFATFMFQVHDGTDPSASAYTMAVHVTAVDDDATGKPLITGTAAVGETLTAEKGDIDDLDGLPETFPDDYTFQWVRVDDTNTVTVIEGATSSTYMPVAADMGSTIKVRVRFTDDANNEEGPLESDATAVVPVPVSIASNHDSIGAGVEKLVFTLTRQGPTANPLAVTVDIVQAELWLKNSEGSYTVPYTVTFLADEATARLEFAPEDISLAPETGGNLTATVSGTGIAGDEAKTVEIVSLAYPPITIAFDEDAYTFAEGAEAEDVNIYVVATLDPAYPRVVPVNDIAVLLQTEPGSAGSPDDFGPISDDTNLGTEDIESGTQQVARHLFAEGNRKFAIVDDDAYEGEEQLAVAVESAPSIRSGLVRYRNADGSFCVDNCSKISYPVTITDEEDVPELSLSAVPTSIPEADDDETEDVAENESTLTVSITNGKTFAAEQTITLTFAGTAPADDYGVAPTDADGVATGHQVALPAGDASVAVTLTAIDNLSRDGNRTVEVSGSLDDVTFDQNGTVTITDDDADNIAPTAEDVEVTTVEDTAYAFSAADFNFTDDDDDDSLVSVAITTLPAAGKGTLELGGTAIPATDLPQTVTADQLQAESLKYTPPADESGKDFATFMFRVSDGTDLSAAAYTMTVHVTAEDAATGQPQITGTAAVGETLTATEGDIDDPNGLPDTFPDDYRFQWVRVDSTDTVTVIEGATSSTYVPVAADMGSTIKVRVRFTDDDNNNEGPLESDPTAVVPVTVAIVSNHDSIGAGVEELVFTLTRQGPTTAPLAVTVDIVQEQLWLKNSEGSHTVSYPVTFEAGEATADLEFTPDQVSLTPETGGNLTAKVSGTDVAGGEKTVGIVSLAHPPITIAFDKDAYTFAEDAEAEDVNVYVVATLDPAYPRGLRPGTLGSPSLRTRIRPSSPQDYSSVRWAVRTSLPRTTCLWTTSSWPANAS